MNYFILNENHKSALFSTHDEILLSVQLFL